MDELISRQAAIEALEDAEDAFGYLTRDWREVLMELPSIQLKRSKWVLVCDNNGMHFVCDKCGAWRYHQEQNFCGECGAEMEVTT